MSGPPAMQPEDHGLGLEVVLERVVSISPAQPDSSSAPNESSGRPAGAGVDARLFVARLGGGKYMLSSRRLR